MGCDIFVQRSGRGYILNQAQLTTVSLHNKPTIRAVGATLRYVAAVNILSGYSPFPYPFLFHTISIPTRNQHTYIEEGNIKDY